MYKKSLKNLKNMGLEVNDEFFSLKEIDAPLLRGVIKFLESIDEKGLKLTTKGFLPTKVVKSIVEVGATEDEKRHLNLQKRFYEVEHFSARLVRLVADVLKLTRKEQGKLLLTKKGKEFLSYSQVEQFVVLFNTMIGLDIGLFDRFQLALPVYNSSLAFLQLLRDKQKAFRPAEVYVAILIDMYPMIGDEIETLEDEFIKKDKFDTFVKIAEVRLLKRLYLPLGLVEIKINGYPEDDEFAKSDLLDLFLKEKNVVNSDLVISKKLIRTLQNAIKEKGLEIDLFEALMFLFMQYAHRPLPPTDMMVDILMQRHKVLGAIRVDYEDFYEKLINIMITTYDKFSELEMVGKVRDDLMRDYTDMIDALFKIALLPKPYMTAQRLLVLPMFVYDLFKIHYGIDPLDEDFILKIEEMFDEEYAEVVGMFIMLANKIEKSGKKLKKSKPNFEDDVKDLIQLYLMVIFEMRG